MFKKQFKERKMFKKIIKFIKDYYHYRTVLLPELIAEEYERELRRKAKGRGK